MLEAGHDGDRRSSHYCLSALLDEPIAARREEIIAALKERGVGTSVYYPKSLPDTQYYRATYGYPERSCPVATQISTCSIALPVGPHVEEGDVETMIDAVRNVVEEMRVRA